jgi:thioredoxin-disulfide reductase
MVFDLVIIGGGPAALTAGIYAARKKIKAVILTKQVGGQTLLAEIIENYPGIEKISGRELIEKMRMQNEKYGVEIKEGEKIELVKKQGEIFLVNSIETKSIIIATGRNPRRLNVPGEKEFEGRGVSFCSTCDAPLFDKKEVAVIGGGNSGLTAALDLAKYTNKVYVLEFMPKITGDELLIEKLKQEGKVEFITDVEIKEIKGGKFVESVVYSAKGGNKELLVGGIFISIGWIPATEFLKGFVNLNEEGEIIIDPKTNETSVKGVFGAGDVTDVKYKQCVIAAAEGAKAALSVYNYLAKS